MNDMEEKEYKQIIKLLGNHNCELMINSTLGMRRRERTVVVVSGFQ